MRTVPGAHFGSQQRIIRTSKPQLVKYLESKQCFQE